MYIRTSSFVSLETTFYIACIQQGFVDPRMQHFYLEPSRHKGNRELDTFQRFGCFKVMM